MTHVERLLGEQGQANRRLGAMILRQRNLETMRTAASLPGQGMNVYGSSCPLCCGDVDTAAAFKSTAVTCQSCGTKGRTVERSRARWGLLEPASAMVSQSGQRTAPQ